MNSPNPRRLAHTCWIALVAMLLLVLSVVMLPAVFGALAASASPAERSRDTVPRAPMVVVVADGFADGFDEGAFDLDLEVDDVPEGLPAALPAALPTAAQAGLPAAGLSPARVHWPDSLQRAAWRPRAWPAWISRGPPRREA